MSKLFLEYEQEHGVHNHQHIQDWSKGTIVHEPENIDVQKGEAGDEPFAEPERLQVTDHQE